MFSLQTGRLTTPYLFRIGGRRKTSPALSTITSTTTPKPTSRPTKFTRRKYPFQTFKPLESQETTTKTTKVTDNRYRFVPRRPFLRTTTPKIESQEFPDQDRESSNQQSLEENLEDGDTTELSDIAVALQELQQAPIRTKTTTSRTSTKKAKSTRGPTSTRFRYSTTTQPPPVTKDTTQKYLVRKVRPQIFDKINPLVTVTYRPITDYDYYDDGHSSIFGRIPDNSKVLIHSNGIIECLDQGNFPHPISCKKFIYCAKMENGNVIGWEYTCPKDLSFDPIGGICNWSAGLGCNED